ncbi:MAG: FG-GAP repeat protein [Planctomycetota bacterium]
MSKLCRIATPLAGAALSLAAPLPALASPDAPWLLGAETKLLPPDPVASDRSGEAVATDGEWVVVGAPRHDHGGFGEFGAVYVYRKTAGGLTLDAELLPNVLKHNQWFGNSVHVDGDTIVVGAHGDDGLCPSSNFCDSGAVYVFVHNGTAWSLQAKLTPSDLESSDRFGSAVRIQGDTLFASSVGDRDAGSGTGSAYVFTRSGGAWSETQKLLASDLARRSNFGASLAVDDDVLVVGAPLDDHGSATSADLGAAYVFRNHGGTWAEEVKLRPSDIHGGMEAGHSVSVMGDLVLIGAPGAHSPLTRAGAAYVFERVSSTWTERQKLVDAFPLQQDHFGSSACLLGDSLVVGSAPELSGAGSVTAFCRTSTGWDSFTRITGSDSNPGDQFGVTAQISSDSLVIGANWHTQLGGVNVAGAAYVYDVQLIFRPYCDALPNSTGLPATLTGAGTTSLSANDFVLSTTGMPANATAVIIYGAGQAQVPLGSGRLCISGALHRVYPPGASNAGGTFVRAIDYASLPSQGAISAGSTWNFQAWFRDTAPGGFNLSSGLQVRFLN